MLNCRVVLQHEGLDNSGESHDGPEVGEDAQRGEGQGGRRWRIASWQNGRLQTGGYLSLSFSLWHS